MAKLHRLVKLDDRQNTHVFTFILPTNIGSDSAKEVSSSEFLCGHQKWSIMLVKQEKESQIGAYLTLKNPTAGLYVTADFGFTMLNRGHYTANESFMDTAKIFSKQQPTQGRKSFISANDVKNPRRGFIMEKDQLYVEVTLCSFKTHFEYQLQLPMTEKDKQRYPPNDIRLETGLFPFGAMEWNINLKINERNPTDVRGGSTVTLKRLSNYDHYCKFNYRVHIGTIDPTPLPGAKTAVSTTPNAANNPNTSKSLANHLHQKPFISSAEMESLFTNADTPDKVVLPTNVYKLASPKGVITIKIECFQVVSLSLLTIPMDRNRHKAMKCYDRDKQVWHFEAHMKSDRLKFYVFYGDIATVPRNCIRMMNIGVSVLPAYGNQKVVNAINSPYTKYYVQRPQDDFGFEVAMPILMKEIIDANSIYVYDNSNTMTVQVEWRESFLLKDIEYTMTDNVNRVHKLQMYKEMTVLQKENLILEKQVHSYQTAIAQKDSKGEYDPSHMATRPQPPGQAQPGYGDSHLDRMPNNMQDPYQRAITQHQMGMNALNQPNGQYMQTTMAMQMAGGQMSAGQNMHGSTSQNHINYDAGYPRNELNMQDQYDRQAPRNPMEGAGGLPVPVSRGPRSKSADPSSSGYYSPTPERRPANRRNSTAGAEYADQLEQSPRYGGRNVTNSYDGYRSDCDYRSDTLSKPNGPRYNEHYGKDGNRPRPSLRTSKPSDSRSDYGDYISERRPKAGLERDVDTYSDRGHKLITSGSGGGGRSGRGQPVGDGRRNNTLNSSSSTGRASYAGYENEYVHSDGGRAGSSYPNTPRSSTAHRNYHRSDDRRPMENGPH